MSIQVDVLIVTVTEAETKAVFEVLGRASGNPKEVTVGGRLYHDFGIINGAYIFHALSEMGAGGVGGAQQSVLKAVNSLKPSAVLMVGIAFGVNEEKQSIGDVLVSQQLSLYDLQRVGKDILLRGDKPHASPRLINFCRMAAFAPATTLPYSVRVGLLLSGAKLIDDIDYRDQLVKLEPEAIGGEMEGEGVYVACHESKTDWIVIKAICDWADGNKTNPKKKEHQALAANNAAIFTLSVLEKAAFKLQIDAPRVRALTEQEQKLLLQLYDFRGTCLIRKPSGEPQEFLWVPGYASDMQWGASGDDDRLSWLYAVRDLHAMGLLDETDRAKEYKLSNRGEEEAWKLSLARPKTARYKTGELTHPNLLDELEEQILMTIGEQEQDHSCNENDVKSGFGYNLHKKGKQQINQVTFDRYLSKLKEKGCITSNHDSRSVYEEVTYSLTDKGRDYLIDNKLL